MNTYFIGKEEIEAYALDLVGRLERLESFPQVWCPVTKSGDAIQKVLAPIIQAIRPQLLEGVRSVSIGVEKTGITFLEEANPGSELSGKSVLLLDGAIHSGDTMNRCTAEILRYQPKELSSYSLVMKVGASFIPTFWGVAIDETDRAFFLLDNIPNHRLDAGPTRRQPPVHLERLSEKHVKLPRLECGVGSMDRMTWSDRYFQMQAAEHPPCTYLLMRSQTIVGYLTVRHGSNGVFSIDEVASTKSSGYGGILMRFADTLARQTNCALVQLNAIENQVSFYLKFGYRKIDGRRPLTLDDEIFWPMERTVLYHQRHR